MVYTSYDQVRDELCQIDDKTNLEIFKDEKIASLYRESNGYQEFYNGGGFQDNDDETQLVMEYKCKDGSYKLNTNFLIYTSDEKQILASKDHCLYLHNYYLDDKSASNEICQKGILTQNAINKGLKCGYFDVTFYLKDGKTKNFKTCYIINPDDFTSGQLNSVTKKLFEQYSLSISDGGDDVTYSFDVTVGDEISGSYDSQEGKLVNNKSKKSTSSMIQLSKYLSILLLILF